MGDGPFLMVLGEGGEGVPMGKMDVLVWGGAHLALEHQIMIFKNVEPIHFYNKLLQMGQEGLGQVMKELDRPKNF